MPTTARDKPPSGGPWRTDIWTASGRGGVAALPSYREPRVSSDRGRAALTKRGGALDADSRLYEWASEHLDRHVPQLMMDCMHVPQLMMDCMHVPQPPTDDGLHAGTSPNPQLMMDCTRIA